MPKLINPVGWERAYHNKEGPDMSSSSPLFSLRNERGNRFHVHPVDNGLVRIVHCLPENTIRKSNSKLSVPKNVDRVDHEGVDGIPWEVRSSKMIWVVSDDLSSKRAMLSCVQAKLHITVDYSSTLVLQWRWGDAEEPFLQDFKFAYPYDARTGRVHHFTERMQSYMPVSEDVAPANSNDKHQFGRFEFLYGLGECKGGMMKDGKRYIMDGRDSLGADPTETDPLYKLCPFYIHYNSKSAFWYGIYYNTLAPSVFDFSAEHDFATGMFRSFSTEAGPLDYYLLLGSQPSQSTRLSSIVEQFAELVTPRSTGLAGRIKDGWQASPVLPPRSQFGYLASSLTLSELKDAQSAVIRYVQDARDHGFPVDSMHLSSGYCVDEKTGNRDYFHWDQTKYPNPSELGKALESDLSCKIIINVKPWLLEEHPWYIKTARKSCFVGAAEDARITSDSDRCSSSFTSCPARTMHWSKGMGETAKGSYFDFTSEAGHYEWIRLIKDNCLAHGITGIWNDNNEFSSIIDDDQEIRGEIELWSLPQILNAVISLTNADAVISRMGWGKRPIAVGSVGRAVLTMGMARSSFEALLSAAPSLRPVVVSRSAVPGMQAFAHSTWSGDNTTSWLSLRYSTKLSMSVGLSFGLGLYGHDIGGFAGEHSPSPELLVRWCQQSALMTRFTIHSWKKISTTPWMYEGRATEIIQASIRLRYRLLPMLYSLYVTGYHRHAVPVVKPLLWVHSSDEKCLGQDEQYLFGTHALVAPVLYRGQTVVTFHLPATVDGEDFLACWYDLKRREWIEANGPQGREVTLDAPLDCLPILLRDGAIWIEGGEDKSHHVLPSPRRQSRLVTVFPTPVHILRARSNQAKSTGAFVLIEDDGVTNDATMHGIYNELEISFVADEEIITITIDPLRLNYPGGELQFDFSAPHGDERMLRIDVTRRKGHESIKVTGASSAVLHV